MGETREPSGTRLIDVGRLRAAAELLGEASEKLAEMIGSLEKDRETSKVSS